MTPSPKWFGLAQRSSKPAVTLVFALLLASISFAQTQTNSLSASLLVNGASGMIGAAPGDPLNTAVGGGPLRTVYLFAGGYTDPGVWTPAGYLHTLPFAGFFVDGSTDPLARTDMAGAFARLYQVPWLAPLGFTFTAQGAVEDPNAPLGLTLTAPAVLTIGAPNVVPQHLFFDPRLGAHGVDNMLPPAGTLPGDLPTLGAFGFEGPTEVFLNNDPVHSVFQNSFYCYLCHGSVPEIWPSYMGTMMANATRDPLFNGQFSIAVAGMEMLQQTGYSAAGGEIAADFCIRCHSTNGWMSGRSSFEGDGVNTAFAPKLFDEEHALDQEGVVCDTCHRATGFVSAINPASTVVAGHPENGQLVFSPATSKRGPFPGIVSQSYNGTTPYGAHIPPVLETTDPPVPHNPPTTEGSSLSPGHQTSHEPFLRESTLCGSCHNVSNPFNGHAVERTYTEWEDSDYGDPTAPEFQTCQGCHMPATANTPACGIGGGSVSGYGIYNKVRGEVRSHAFVGGNAWIPQIFKLMYPNVDQNWSSGLNYTQNTYYSPPSRATNWDATTAAAISTLRSAAHVDLSASEPTTGSIQASVRVTNLTGHKLPTGYPEGRRMWVQIRAVDGNGATIFQSGSLDANSELVSDPQIKVYEAKHGLDYPTLGLYGPSFHFILNNVPVKDNRILPKGMTQRRGTGGTDSYDPVMAPWPVGGLYPDGQHWDTTVYTIPVAPGTPRPIRVTATALYQTVSFDYVNFLANGGDATVQTQPHPDAVLLRNFWQNGYPAPAIPVGVVGPTSTPDPTAVSPNQTALVILP